MTELLAAIIARCAATPAIAAALPAFEGHAVAVYVGRAPEKAPLPRVILTVIPGGTWQDRLGPGGHYECTVQFSLYGVGLAASGAIMQTVVGAFDDHDVTLATGDCFFGGKDCEPWPQIQDETIEGEEVWGWYCDFTFAVQP